MGTRHLNLLFFLPEGENPFPSQPFLKRNFDLLNPEARVFISSTAGRCGYGDLWGPLYLWLCFPSSAALLLQLPLGWRLAPRILSKVTLPSLKSLALDVK